MRTRCHAGRSFRASDVFRNLPKQIKEQVFRMAAGKLVYFASNNRRKPVEKAVVCRRYAKGLSFAEVGSEFGISRGKAFKIVADERAGYSRDRIRLWQNSGLSLRQIARLFKKSHAAARSIRGG